MAIQRTDINTVKLSITQDSNDGSSVSLSSKDSAVASIFPLGDDEAPYQDQRLETSQEASLLASPSPPPPFSSLYSPSAQHQGVRKASIIEPEPPPPFYPAHSPLSIPSASTSALAQETKAALPRDTKAESSSKAAEEADPPPPYSDGSSPLDSFTYVMAAAGGPASIITQVQQTGPQQGNSLAGRFSLRLEDLTDMRILIVIYSRRWRR